MLARRSFLRTAVAACLAQFIKLPDLDELLVTEEAVVETPRVFYKTAIHITPELLDDDVYYQYMSKEVTRYMLQRSGTRFLGASGSAHES